MLALDSPRWSALRHAYGDATDLPPVLRRLTAGDGTVMDQLVNCVCHQGSSIYSASYATVPHLVAAARVAKDVGLRAEILALVGGIRASSDDRSDIPLAADLRRWYEGACSQALALALATLREPIDPFDAVYLLEAAAAEDPVQVPATRRTRVIPGPVTGSPLAQQYHWLMEVAGPAALSVIGKNLSSLFGSAECPACGAVLSVIDEL